MHFLTEYLNWLVRRAELTRRLTISPRSRYNLIVSILQIETQAFQTFLALAKFLC